MKNLKLLTEKYKSLTKRGKMITCLLILMILIFMLDLFA